MITGDIDLTEKLDFYRDKEDKKKNHQSTALIPWKTKKEESPNDFGVDVSYFYNNWTSLSSSTFNTTTLYTNSYSTLSFSTIDNYTITYNINNNSGSWSNNDIMAVSITSRGTIGNNNYISIDNNSTTIDFISYPVEWKVGGGDSSKHYLPEKRERRRVYSDLFIKECYYCGKYLGLTCKCKKNDTNKETQKFLELCEDSDRRKEYKQRELEYHSEHNEVLFGKPNYQKRREMALRYLFDYDYKPRRKIPWLQNLPERIYDDYIRDLFEEHDYSSYLTDMHWLRIRK